MGMFDKFYLAEGVKCPNCRKGPDFDVGSTAKSGEFDVGEKTLKVIILHDGKAGIKTLQTKDLARHLETRYFPSILTPDDLVCDEPFYDEEDICGDYTAFLVKKGINVYHPCNNCDTLWEGSISLKTKVVDGKEAYLTERLVLEGFCEESILPYTEELSESEVYDLSLEQSLTETDEQARQKVIITLTPRLEKCIEAYLRKAEAYKVKAVKYLSALNEIVGIADSAGQPYSDYIKRLPECQEPPGIDRWHDAKHDTMSHMPVVLDHSRNSTHHSRIGGIPMFKEPVLSEGTSQFERLQNALNYMTALKYLENDAPSTIIVAAFLVQFLHNDRIMPLLQITGLLQQYESFRAVQYSWLKSVRGRFSSIVNATFQYYFHNTITSEIWQKCKEEISSLKVPENNDATIEWLYTTRKTFHQKFAAELNSEYEKLLSASACRKEDMMIVEMLKKNGRDHLHNKLSSLLTEKVKKHDVRSKGDVESRVLKFSIGH